MVNAVKILWLIALDGTGQSIIHRIGHPPVWEASSNMSSIKCHRPCIVSPFVELSVLWSINGQWDILLIRPKKDPLGERTPREGIRVWESIMWQSADFTLLIIGNPGALVTFFNHIPGLLFPKKIM